MSYFLDCLCHVSNTHSYTKDWFYQWKSSEIQMSFEFVNQVSHSNSIFEQNRNKYGTGFSVQSQGINYPRFKLAYIFINVYLKKTFFTLPRDN